VDRLLSTFGAAFGATAAVALAAAFAWGVLSVALSPCHLSSVPLVVAYMSGGTELPSGRRALGLSSAFAVGILVSIALIGGVTAAAGRMIGDVGRTGTWFLAGVFLVVGLNLLGILPAPSLPGRPAQARRRGAAGAALLGLTFGVALGPCTFAFMAPLLALALGAGGRGAAWYGAVLVAVFGLGHAMAIAGAGSSLQSVNRWLGSKGGAHATTAVRAAAGVAVILGGVYFVWSAL
jgi:cytochrome c-type biogenesis protein